MARSDRSKDDRVKRARALYKEGVAGGALAAIGGSLAGSSIVNGISAARAGGVVPAMVHAGLGAIGGATAVIATHSVKSAGNSLENLYKGVSKSSDAVVASKETKAFNNPKEF